MGNNLINFDKQATKAFHSWGFFLKDVDRKLQDTGMYKCIFYMLADTFYYKPLLVVNMTHTTEQILATSVHDAIRLNKIPSIVKRIPCQQFLKSLGDYKYAGEIFEEYMDDIERANLVIFDEILSQVTEKIQDYYLIGLLNEAQRLNKPTIFTSSSSSDELSKKLSLQVQSFLTSAIIVQE